MRRPWEVHFVRFLLADRTGTTDNARESGLSAHHSPALRDGLSAEGTHMKSLPGSLAVAGMLLCGTGVRAQPLVVPAPGGYYPGGYASGSGFGFAYQR